MTATVTALTRPTSTPRPASWATLREHAPEVVDDLADLWARLDTLDAGAATGEPIDVLRSLVEHLAGNVESLVDDLLAAREPFDGPGPTWYPGDWREVTPGRWETDPADLDAPPKVEATVVLGDQGIAWYWTLYRRNGAGGLDVAGTGTSPTLAHARDAVDAAARALLEAETGEVRL